MATPRTMRLSHRLLDRLGMSASTICAIHCIALPFAMSFLPLLGVSFLAHGTFEIVMIMIALVIGGLSLGSSYRVHGKLNPILMMASGVTILIFNFFGHEAHGGLAETLHPYIAGFGGLMVAAAHRVNMKLCASCEVCVHDHEHEGHTHGANVLGADALSSEELPAEPAPGHVE